MHACDRFCVCSAVGVESRAGHSLHPPNLSHIQSYRSGVQSGICQHWGSAFERHKECDYKAIIEDVLCI